MPNLNRSTVARAFKLAFILLALLYLPSAAAGEELSRVTGWLDTLWGDSAPNSGEGYRQIVQLTTDDGQRLEVEMGDGLRRVGGIARWSGKHVEVTLSSGEDDAVARIVAVRLLAGADVEGAGGGVSGSVPWVTIPCKFADVAAEPRNLTFFEEMYANVPGGLDHYWREVSYDIIDVVGSIAVDWVTLPNNQTHYVPTPGSGCFGTPDERADLNALFAACTAAADAIVDFSNGGDPFAGINLMFNADLDGCAWGGGRFATLDGVTKSWRTTWEPPWGYANEGVMAHEMGHGMGLPHANNSDGDGNPYDSPWDVMSAATSYAVSDPVYGALGKHINAYHKLALGWIVPSEIFEAPAGLSSVTIDQTALASTSNFRMARIPIDGASYYAIEVRDQVGNYDGAVPGNAVIIHEVVPGRSEPSWVVDGDNPPANFADTEGVMWRVGETFSDPANEIAVRVVAATADGFQVEITNGALAEIFADGFESGDLSAWN